MNGITADSITIDKNVVVLNVQLTSIDGVSIVITGDNYTDEHGNNGSDYILNFNGIEDALLSSGRCEFFTSFDGDGTVDKPYQISNVCQLQNMDETRDAWYEIVSDINATVTRRWNNGKGFDPIGDLNLLIPFIGNFDGKDYTIDGFVYQTFLEQMELHYSVISME